MSSGSDINFMFIHIFDLIHFRKDPDTILHPVNNSKGYCTSMKKSSGYYFIEEDCSLKKSPLCFSRIVGENSTETNEVVEDSCYWKGIKFETGQVVLGLDGNSSKCTHGSFVKQLNCIKDGETYVEGEKVTMYDGKEKHCQHGFWKPLECQYDKHINEFIVISN